jgi:hypothetical protein
MTGVPEVTVTGAISFLSLLSLLSQLSVSTSVLPPSTVTCVSVM